MGGSLGAKSINEKMLEMAQKLSSPIQVIHILGKQGEIEEVKKRYDALNIKSVVKRFEDNMQHAYAISSFSLARAGAATIAELIHFELPAILIPYPFAKDRHQLKNAIYFEDQVKGGVCIEEKDFSELFTMLNTFLDEKFLESKKSDINLYKSSLSDFSIAEIFS